MSAYRFIEALRGVHIPPPAKSVNVSLSIAQTCREVMALYGLSHDDFYSESRVRRISWPRQEAMALAHNDGKSISAIARHFGFDHTTVIYSIRAYNRRQERQ